MSLGHKEPKEKKEKKTSREEYSQNLELSSTYRYLQEWKVLFRINFSESVQLLKKVT